jgi:hypothetical protein
MDPVLHLSIVVDDLTAARAFYVDTLGCRLGRERDGWMDVWFFGLQLTLQCRPDQARSLEEQGVRHFGATLSADEFAVTVGRLEADPAITWLVPVTTDHAGTPRQQTKCKLADPAGNVIELKTYADPVAAFAP